MAEARTSPKEGAQDALGIGIDGQRPALEALAQRLERLEDGTLYGAIRFHHRGRTPRSRRELRLRPGHAVVEHRASLHYPQGA